MQDHNNENMDGKIDRYMTNSDVKNRVEQYRKILKAVQYSSKEQKVVFTLMNTIHLRYKYVVFFIWKLTLNFFFWTGASR